jgi:hypothetical protein
MPRELTQAYRSGSLGTEDLYSPLTLEDYANIKCSVAHILCIQAIHIALSAALLPPNRNYFGEVLSGK